MKMNLNEFEVRVLGCLVEKELATPEYYPLTLNALTAACNQKSNRDPVLSMEEADVVRALDSLRGRGFARQSAEGVRAMKYCHCLTEKLLLEPPDLAVLAELLLRGPQTVGELRGRAERMRPFADLAAVEKVLHDLMERDVPLVTRLPRQPGRKENRFTHLFSGEPPVAAEEPTPAPEAARRQVMAENERLDRLEAEVTSLREEVAALRQMVAEFRAQFE
ncbi:YceH family protein [Geobacter sp.]|uniref:YceH family protein n=1 Tax=Geobacter sp. TaxID=46610 RepID=UPI0026209DD9|nr:YceH family protein [Geobacter sp.]